MPYKHGNDIVILILKNNNQSTYERRNDKGNDNGFYLARLYE